MMVIPVVVGALVTVPKSLEERLEWSENQRKSQDHPYHSFVKIGQNTKKSLGALRRLAVTQTSVKNNRLKLVQKIHEELDNKWKKIMIKLFC